MRLTAVRGCPGTGKTTSIIERAERGELDCVVTYTKDAAGVVRARSPNTIAGTVYSLSWPWVKECGVKHSGRGRTHKSYVSRAVRGGTDPALGDYVRDAPSAQRIAPSDASALQELQRWDGTGTPPHSLSAKASNKTLRFAQSLARWVAEGCPKDEGEGFQSIALDEAQDFSMLELTAALGMLAPGGQAWAYGDPGQAVFSESKGLIGDELPPAWAVADAHEDLIGGYRVGEPCATAAARALSPWLSTDAAHFAAPAPTHILTWDTSAVAPRSGLVLGWGRHQVVKAFKEWGLTDTWVTPHSANPNERLVICTGHAAKGAEADDVYMLPLSRKAEQRILSREPAALRWLYVVMTRARKRLFVPPTLKAIIPR